MTGSVGAHGPRERAALFLLNSRSLQAIAAAYITDGKVDWPRLIADSGNRDGQVRLLIAVASEFAGKAGDQSTIRLADLVASLTASQLRDVLDATAISRDLPPPRAPEREIRAAHGEFGDPDGLAVNDGEGIGWFILRSETPGALVGGSFNHPTVPGDRLHLATTPGHCENEAREGVCAAISAHNAARLGTICLRFAMAAGAPPATLEHARLRVGILLR